MVEWMSKMTAHSFTCGNLKMNIDRHEFKVLFIIPLHFTSSKFCNSLLPILNILEAAKIHK